MPSIAFIVNISLYACALLSVAFMRRV